MTKIYSGPGRAIKQCPNCSCYIHVKNSICPQCEHSFDKTGKPKVKKVVNKTVHTSAGRGRKVCVGCHKFVGVRCHTCPSCGYVFTKTVTVSKPVSTPVVTTAVKETPKSRVNSFPTTAENEAWEDIKENDLNFNFIDAINGHGRKIIHATGEDCPIKIFAKNEAAYSMFCRALVEYGLEHGVVYTPRAIKYHGRQILGANSKEYKSFVAVVDKYVDILINGEEE